MVRAPSIPESRQYRLIVCHPHDTHSRDTLIQIMSRRVAARMGSTRLSCRDTHAYASTGQIDKRHSFSYHRYHAQGAIETRKKDKYTIKGIPYIAGSLQSTDLFQQAAFRAVRQSMPRHGGAGPEIKLGPARPLDLSPQKNKARLDPCSCVCRMGSPTQSRLTRSAPVGGLGPHDNKTSQCRVRTGIHLGTTRHLADPVGIDTDSQPRPR